MVAIGNDDADGPTRITGKSMFGPQVLSQRHTAAAHGFGSSTRAHASKLFIGGEHAKLSSAQNSDTPGPHYATLGSVGTQAEGGKPSPPTWKLGKADRFVHDRYAARFQGASPGPGTYNHGSSVGRQPFSTNTTFPKYGFGTSNREQCSKLFVSSQHSVGGSQSPGPASVGQMSELSGSKYGFGTERRLGTSREDAASAAIPGPIFAFFGKILAFFGNKRAILQLFTGVTDGHSGHRWSQMVTGGHSWSQNRRGLGAPVEATP